MENELINANLIQLFDKTDSVCNVNIPRSSFIKGMKSASVLLFTSDLITDESFYDENFSFSRLSKARLKHIKRLREGWPERIQRSKEEFENIRRDIKLKNKRKIAYYKYILSMRSMFSKTNDPNILMNISQEHLRNILLPSEFEKFLEFKKNLLNKEMMDNTNIRGAMYGVHESDYSDDNEYESDVMYE